MNTIPLFFSQYYIFSSKFQSAHFVLFRNVRLCRSYSTVQIYFIKSLGNSVLSYFNAKVSINSFRDSSCHKSILSLAVVFLGKPGGFLASHDPVSSNFLKIPLLDFLTILEISPIKILFSLCNMTISFLRSNDVTDFFSMFAIQDPVKSRCNLVKYPIL